MERIPALGRPITYLEGEHHSNYEERAREAMTITCLDLDRVPEDVRQDAIHGLALGAPLRDKGADLYRYDQGLTGEWVPSFGAHIDSYATKASVPGFIGFVAFLCTLKSLPTVAWWISGVVIANAAIIMGVGVIRWFRKRVKPVPLQEYVTAEATGLHLGDADAHVVVDTRAYLHALVKTLPLVSEEVWLAAYQAQADIAVARGLDILPEAKAKQRAKLLRDRAKETMLELKKLHQTYVALPAKRREEAEAKKAAHAAGLAELVKQDAARKALAGHLDDEPVGNFLEIAAAEGAEPEGNYTEIAEQAPQYATYPGAPATPVPGKRGRMGRRAG